MRVLILTPELPARDRGGGGATRQFHLLSRLGALGHHVAVVAPLRRDQGPWLAELEDVGASLFVSRRPASRAAEGIARLRREPRLAARAVADPVLAWQAAILRGGLEREAGEALARFRPDVALVEHDHAADWARLLPPELPKVLTLHNVGWRYYAARARAAAPPARAALGLEARRFLRHDLRAFPLYRRLIAVSVPDRAALLSEGVTLPVDVVPNGVAAAEIAALPAPDAGDSLLFTGTLDHPPNEEGIRWFVAEAWPRIRAARPGARLSIVGRNPPAGVRRLAGAGVEVVGPVDDMEPWFARATVVIAPLLSGGGTRLKVIEALARGRAIVATHTAAEGLELRDGEHLLLADGPGAFAAAVVGLLEAPRRREALVAGGRAAVEERYDWRLLGEALGRSLERAALAGEGGVEGGEPAAE